MVIILCGEKASLLKSIIVYLQNMNFVKIKR